MSQPSLRPPGGGGLYSSFCTRQQRATDQYEHSAIRATHPAAPEWRRRWYRKIENSSPQARAHLDRRSPVERAAALLLFLRAAWWFDLPHRPFADARRDRTPVNAPP